MGRKKITRRRPWADSRWVTRSLGCWDWEWDLVCEGAALAGVTPNGWLRLCIVEFYRYEKANAMEREDGRG